MEIERPDVGALVLSHRDAAGLTQADLAGRAGVTQGAVSAIERNRRDPSLGTLCRVLEAMDLTLRLDVGQRQEALDAAIDEALARPPADRLRNRTVDGIAIAERLSAAAPILDGVAGAAIHGAPVTVDRVDVIVTDTALDAVAAGMRRLAADRWSQRWRQWGLEDPDPRRPGPMRWLTFAGEVRVTVAARPPEAVTVLVGEHLVRVRPLHEIEAGDQRLARVLGRLRERLAAR
jgi:transcriptional regulator with XRE-family HTH domain